MALHLPPTSVLDWVADFDATHHTTSSVGNISTLHPWASSNPSSIIVGNCSSLLITFIDDSVLLGPFYLNNILLAHDMVQSLFSIRRFTTDNWCSMKFDPFGLFVKDLTTKNVIIRSNSTGPLYTTRLPRSLTPSFSVVAALVAVPHTLIVVAPTTWHRRLCNPGSDALFSLSRSSFIQCIRKKHDFCHACQLGKHTRLPFVSHPIVRNILLIFGHRLLLVCRVLSIIWLFLMILLIIYGPFPRNLNLTPSLLCLISLPMRLLNLAGLSKLSSVTMGVSLTTLPPTSSSCQMAHNSGCRVLTRPHEMVKLNVLFIRLTMSFALC
jgi:hypothetical protein